MSEIVPDPEFPERQAIDDEVNLLGGVSIAPIGADPLDPTVWKHVGWSKGFMFGDDS